MTRISTMLSLPALLLWGTFALAGDTPQEARHELMEDVGDAAKPIGKMLKGEMAFDAAIPPQSFQTWKDAAARLGDLFPEGSEAGYDTEAKATIWSDRAGFEAEIQGFTEAVEAAIEAGPQDLESLKAAAGPVFKQCKSCHEGYRVEDED
jgi:cytochrome c556